MATPTREEALRQLELVRKLRAHPDFAKADADAKASLDAFEKGWQVYANQPAPRSTQVPLTPERQEKVRRRYEETKLPEPETNFWGDVGRGLVDQVGGTAAAAVNAIPGAAAQIETLSDINNRMLTPVLRLGRPRLPDDPAYMQARDDVERQIRSEMPGAPGTFRRLEESAPSPFAAKLTGAALPIMAGASTVKPIAGAAKAAFTPAVETFNELAGQTPGLIRTMAASGGAAGVQATSDAATRRIPAALAGENVPPIDVAGELAAPTGTGVALGVIPGAASWASNPRTRTGALASRSAADRTAGVTSTPERRMMPVGNEGIAKARSVGQERTAQAREAAATEFAVSKPVAELPVEQAGQRALSELSRRAEVRQGAREMDRGQAATHAEAQVWDRFNELRSATNTRLKNVLDRREQEGSSFIFDGFLQDLRALVSREARPDTAGARQVMKTPQGEVEGPPGSGEVHTPFGRQLRAIEVEANKYIPEGQPATVRQVRNFQKYLKGEAESGSPERSFPAKQALKSIRDRLAEQDPEIDKALKDWRRATDDLEMRRKQIYGSEDLHRNPVVEPEDAMVDAPETGAKSLAPPRDPKEMEAGRRYLSGVGRVSAAESIRAPDRKAMADSGFGEPLERMEARNAELEQMGIEDARTLQRSKGVIEADVASEKARVNRALKRRTDEPVKAAKAAEEDLVFSKAAEEAARLRSPLSVPLKLVRAGMWAGLGHPTHAMAMGGEGLVGSVEALTVPVASRVAGVLPDAAAARAFVPNAMGLSRLMLNRRNVEDVADDLTKKARSAYGQAGRLKAGLFEIAGANRRPRP